MKNKSYFAILFTVFIIYVVIQSTNYMVEYRIEEYEKSIEEIENEISELMIKENLSLSRETAINKYNLAINNNSYYLEEEDE